MEKPVKTHIILSPWTFAVTVLILASLVGTFLFFVREIFVLQSRVEEQERKIESLERITTQMKDNNVGDKTFSTETKEVIRRCLKPRV